MDRNSLLNDLHRRILRQQQWMEQWKAMEEEFFFIRPAAGKWNVAEIMEHLLRYGDFYLPVVQERLTAAPESQRNSYRPGWLGNYFAQSLLPGAKKMKTFKKMNPTLEGSVRQGYFLALQEQIHQWNTLLQMAQTKDLQRIVTPISISQWIKLRMGDTLRVVIFHQDRHFEQMESILRPLLSENPS